MSDHPAPQGVLDEASSQNHSDGDGSLTELRRLLIGPEQKQLVEIEERLNHQETLLPEDVSRVLPEAVRLRTKRDKKVTEALLPTVEEAIDISVRKNPQTLIDALFPVIGPAIRKAISEALSTMVQSMNQTLEHSFSPQGLKWRLEAWRTGKTFGEVVLTHTLLYRVEQVFLIHKETGLLLQHVMAGTAAVQDADMVSGMLTAIQDFVHDSFSTGKGDTLDALKVGELTVWIEQGPHAILAGVIRGNAPQELRNVFRVALEQIHLEFANELENFEGDAAVFEGSKKYLETCLEAQYGQAPGKTEKVKKRITPVRVIALVLLLGLLIWGFFYIRERWRWGSYVERLKQEPGIVVTNAERNWFGYTLTGLRDPLARDPQALLNESKLDADEVESRWEPYQALTPQFVLARSKALLNPPQGVEFRVENNVLYASGTANHAWVAEARKLVRFIPGISQFNEDNLVDTDYRAVLTIKDQIEKRVLKFVYDTPELVGGQAEALDALRSDISKLAELAPVAGKSVIVEIVGHTDQLGSEEKNLQLSRERAEQIRNALAERLAGVNGVRLSAVGVGTKEPVREERTDEDKEQNRSVTVKVRLSEI
jgi:outer membrane protein OmpA-like peptidoglycan-associated protein